MLPEHVHALLEPAVGRAETWADLGAGRGTFTAALARITGAGGHVIAVDNDVRAVAALARLGGGLPTTAAAVTAAQGDIHDLAALHALDGLRLHGVLFANTLHFSRSAGAVLAAAARRLESDGRIIVIEYANRSPSRWVPWPLGLARLDQLARTHGLRAPRRLAEVPSDYGGTIYSAAIDVTA